MALWGLREIHNEGLVYCGKSSLQELTQFTEAYLLGNRLQNGECPSDRIRR